MNIIYWFIIQDRIITMKLNTKPNILNVVQVYYIRSHCHIVIDENTDKYYESLEATLNVSIPISRKPQQSLIIEMQKLKKISLIIDQVCRRYSRTWEQK